MKARWVVPIWFLITAFLTWEYLAINYAPKSSLIDQAKVYLPEYKELKLSTESNKNFGYALGWAGISIILLTNFYILRKRFGLMASLGSTRGWLNFHILCGMVGPTCVIFHSNFKVGGVVAISFWSMMIVATSGMLGKYFYLQIAGEIEDIRDETLHWERVLKRMVRKSGRDFAQESVDGWKRRAVRYVGANVQGSGLFFMINVIFSSLMGDLRLSLVYPRSIPHLHRDSNVVLCNYALSVRRGHYLTPFKKLLGYWHSFHVPFTVIMYICAAIHIFVALMFQVKT